MRVWIDTNSRAVDMANPFLSVRCSHFCPSSLSRLSIPHSPKPFVRLHFRGSWSSPVQTPQCWRYKSRVLPLVGHCVVLLSFPRVERIPLGKPCTWLGLPDPGSCLLIMSASLSLAPVVLFTVNPWEQMPHLCTLDPASFWMNPAEQTKMTNSWPLWLPVSPCWWCVLLW